MMMLLVTFGAYLASLMLLLRWFSASRATHVLPAETIQPARRDGVGMRWQVFYAVPALGIAGAALVLEAKGLALVASWALSLDCQDGWLLAADCSLEADQKSHPGRGVALVILAACSTVFAITRRLMHESVFYPASTLMLGILGFGAACDLVAGGGGSQPQIVFKVAAGLQLTAAAALALGLVVLQVHALGVLIRGLAAHMAGACVRTLAALTMLSAWPALPAASAGALLLAVMLVPGVASALSAIAALGAAQNS